MCAAAQHATSSLCSSRWAMGTVHSNCLCVSPRQRRATPRSVRRAHGAQSLRRAVPPCGGACAAEGAPGQRRNELGSCGSARSASPRQRWTNASASVSATRFWWWNRSGDSTGARTKKDRRQTGRRAHKRPKLLTPRAGTHSQTYSLQRFCIVHIASWSPAVAAQAQMCLLYKGRV